MPSIELYGYDLENEDQERPMRLREVTFLAKPDVLREIAKFLLQSADLLEEHGPRFGHNHLRDTWSGWEITSGDVIVSAPDP